MSSIFQRLVLISATLLFSFNLQAEPLGKPQLEALIDKAESGDVVAQMELANRYYAGDGVSKDHHRAAKLFTKLAENGVANAQMTLAMMYIRGEGIDKNDKQAIHWLTQAAEQRLAPAQYYLGLAYSEGHGVAIDNVTAYMWYEIAAAMDYQDAVEATKTLAEKMSKQDVQLAEQKATQWWMRFHH